MKHGLYKMLLDAGFVPSHSFLGFSRLLAFYVAGPGTQAEQMHTYFTDDVGYDELSVIDGSYQSGAAFNSADFGVGNLSVGKAGEGIWGYHPPIIDSGYRHSSIIWRASSFRDILSNGSEVSPPGRGAYVRFGAETPWTVRHQFANGNGQIPGAGVAGALTVRYERFTSASTAGWVADENENSDYMYGKILSTNSERRVQIDVIPMAWLRSGRVDAKGIAGALGIALHDLLGCTTLVGYCIERDEMGGGTGDAPADPPPGVPGKKYRDPISTTSLVERSCGIGLSGEHHGFAGATPDEHAQAIAGIKAYFGIGPDQTFLGFDVFGNAIVDTPVYGPKSMSFCSKDGAGFGTAFYWGEYMGGKLAESMRLTNQANPPEQRVSMDEINLAASKISGNFGYFVKVSEKPVKGPENVWREVRMAMDVADKKDFLDSQVLDDQRARDVMNRIANTEASVWAWPAYSRGDIVFVSVDRNTNLITFRDEAQLTIGKDQALRDITNGADMVLVGDSLNRDLDNYEAARTELDYLIRLDDYTNDTSGGPGIDANPYWERGRGMEWVCSYGKSGYSDTAKVLLQLFRLQCTPVSAGDGASMFRSESFGFAAHDLSSVPPGPEYVEPPPGPGMTARIGDQMVAGLHTGKVFSLARPYLVTANNWSSLKWPNPLMDVNLDKGQVGDFYHHLAEMSGTNRGEVLWLESASDSARQHDLFYQSAKTDALRARLHGLFFKYYGGQRTPFVPSGVNGAGAIRFGQSYAALDAAWTEHLDLFWIPGVGAVTPDLSISSSLLEFQRNDEKSALAPLYFVESGVKLCVMFAMDGTLNGSPYKGIVIGTNYAADL